MNRQSIFLKLNIIFFVALVSVLLVAFFIIRGVHAYNTEILKFKSRLIFKEIRIFDEIPLELINELDFDVVKAEDKKDILDNATLIRPMRKDYFNKRNTKRRDIKKFRDIISFKKKTYLMRYEGYNFIYIKYLDIDLLLKGRFIFLSKTLTAFIAIIGAIALLIIMYILLRKSLMPLKRLKVDIEDYGNGKEIKSKYSNKKDEVSLIANSFYGSIERIEKVEASKKLFIRNISHELNTPITKGKILSEIIKDTKQKDLLNSIFTRLSLLVKQLISTEQITSKTYSLSFKKVRIQEIIDEASDLLYLDFVIPSNIKQEIMNVDFKSMSIVFKNLIDNAIKYGDNINIKIENKTINFISDGDEIKDALLNDDEKFLYNKNENGFGLGLYIVQEILQAHNMKITYNYNEGENIFSIFLT